MQIGISWDDVIRESIHGGIPGAVILLGYFKLKTLLVEFRLHRHDEDKEDVDPQTTLTVRGLTYPRSMNGK